MGGGDSIVCGGHHTWVSWFTFFLSLVLLPVPAVRVFKTQRKRGIKHTFFWWSLLLGLYTSIVWASYFVECRYRQAMFPVLVTSVTGALIHYVLCAASIADSRHVVERNLFLTLGPVMMFFVVTMSPASFNGWLGLSLGVISQMFKMKVTDYEPFDWIPAIASLIGCVNSFLWLLHHSLRIAMQYKISSYIIGVLRGWEVFLWVSPWIGTVLWRLDGGEGDGRND